MELPEVWMVPVAKIDANPYRDLGTYPVLRPKVDALKASFKVVGIWPSIIVRKKGSRFEQAFGHQRLTAAKEMGIKEVPVVVMDLTEEQMVQYMGRENGEDYSADFLIMLNTWEAGAQYLAFRDPEKTQQPVAIARLLGWTRISYRQTGEHEVMTDIANACSGAHRLIEGGHNTRNDFQGISVSTAKDIVGRALSRMTTIEQMGKAAGAPAKEIEHAKRVVGHGVRETAREVRSGTLAPKRAAGQVDLNTLKAAGKEKGKPEAVFGPFVHAMAGNINKMLQYDTMAENLAEVVKVLDFVKEARDKAILRGLDFELGELRTRASEWQNRLTTGKVKPFPTTAQIGGPKRG